MSLSHRPEYIARRYFAQRGLCFTHNRTLAGSWIRPDFLFSRRSRGIAIVAECDENAHQGYNKSKEIHREHVIARHLVDMGYHTVYVLRFDPKSSKSGIMTRASTKHLARVANTIIDLLDGKCVDGMDTRRRLFTKIVMM
jgi:hypothetical protein